MLQTQIAGALVEVVAVVEQVDFELGRVQVGNSSQPPVKSVDEERAWEACVTKVTVQPRQASSAFVVASMDQAVVLPFVGEVVE